MRCWWTLTPTPRYFGLLTLGRSWDEQSVAVEMRTDIHCCRSMEECSNSVAVDHTKNCNWAVVIASFAGTNRKETKRVVVVAAANWGHNYIVGSAAVGSSCYSSKLAAVHPPVADFVLAIGREE